MDSPILITTFYKVPKAPGGHDSARMSQASMKHLIAVAACALLLPRTAEVSAAARKMVCVLKLAEIVPSARSVLAKSRLWRVQSGQEYNAFFDVCLEVHLLTIRVTFCVHVIPSGLCQNTFHSRHLHL